MMNLQDTFRSDFETNDLCNTEWLKEQREKCFEKFIELGFPDNRIEEWKYTNIKKIANEEYRISKNQEKLNISEFTKYEPRIVLVNGRISKEMSSFPEKIEILPLIEAIENGILKREIFEDNRMEENPFWALNTAFMNSGLYLRIPNGIQITEPVLIINIANSDETPTICHPRNIIEVEKGGKLSVMEHYIDNGKKDTLTNSVTQIYTEENGLVEHIMKTNLSERGVHIGNVNAYQERDSKINTHNFCMGGKVIRNDLNFSLRGNGSYCEMNGLYLVDGDEHVDNHTTVEHLVPHCSSKEHYKGIVGGKGSAVFNGRIHVHEKAQKTDAIQNNENLLMTDDAVIHTKPELEIYADDVKCTHGATIGQIDEDALFYLRCRGIEKKEAREIMIKAYVGEIIERVENEKIQNMLETEIMASLPIEVV